MLVSIYLPTRNRVDLLQRAVRSVLAQTVEDFELIVVDDASTDRTPDYLSDLARRDPRVVVHRSDQPRGAPHARNWAIRRSRGAWVTGLDDDDEFMPRRLEAALAVAQAYERAQVAFSALYTQDEVVDSRGSVTTRKPPFSTLEALFRQNCVGNQLFARRERYLDAGLYDETLPAWQDLDMAMSMVARCGPARLVDVPLYRLHNDDRPDRISRKRKRDIVAAWRIVSAKWPDQTPALHQQLYLQVLSAHYGFDLEWDDFRTFLSLGYGPSSVRRLLKSLRERRPPQRLRELARA